jgi:hypothetical protein
MKDGAKLTTRYSLLMPDATKQKTRKGAEIPIPTRKEFYADLDKVVKAPVPPRQKKAAPPTG